ncbi:MAG TPA: hypothetical protein VJA94_08430 [Candidatus Angelobacter sp.]
MTSLLLPLTLLLSGALQTAPNPSVPPKFEDYRVTEQYKGKNAKPVLTRHDLRFRTRITEGAQEKVNFAGHYILTTWGCGGGCVTGVVIDAPTGKVYWLPFTICCWPVEVEDPIQFRVDSRLVIFTGSRNEKGQGVYYYKFEGNRFVLLQAVEKP